MICYPSLCLCAQGRFLFLNAPTIFLEVNTRMPNAKVLSEKQAIVAELTEKIQKASAGVLVDYKGITVEEDTARVMSDYAKKLNDKFEIKGGFMDGKPVSLETIQSLASIPALPVLRAQFLGTMLAPITGLAVVLKQIAEKGGEPVAVAAEEAAPAAE